MKITASGRYPNIPAEIYHQEEICPAPSISSTGLKRLSGSGKGCTPRHYWEGSPLNPNRRPFEDTDSLRFGRAFHDAVLLPERWRSDAFYHITCEGFSRSKTKAMADEIAECDAAIAAGKEIISFEESVVIEAMARAIQEHPVARSVFTAGEPEVTYAWQDGETGVWLRARLDWEPSKLQIIPDLKSASDASPEGFSKAIGQHRYIQSAALQCDAIKAVHGFYPSNYLHVVVERPGKDWRPGDYIPVALYELPQEDIERGRWLNREAIQTFARCLSTGEWPGYADVPKPVGLPGWARNRIENPEQHEAAWSAAA